MIASGSGKPRPLAFLFHSSVVLSPAWTSTMKSPPEPSMSSTGVPGRATPIWAANLAARWR